MLTAFYNPIVDAAYLKPHKRFSAIQVVWFRRILPEIHFIIAGVNRACVMRGLKVQHQAIAGGRN